jgi:hypothetical protein
MSHLCFKFLLLLKHVFLSSEVFLLLNGVFFEFNSFSSFKKKIVNNLLEPYDFFLNYNVKSIFKIFKMFWLSFQHYQLTNHFSCKANIWEAYWNIMNLGTKKNLHIEHTL